MFNWFVKKINNKKGFTLVELVVVIAVLAILSAIAVPRFSSMQLNAQQKADEASARTIASAVTMALAKNNGTLPEAADDIADDINEFLNDIEVTVEYDEEEPEEPEGWTVIFPDTSSIGFKVYKGAEQKYPIVSEGSGGDGPEG